jgi:hypothetical protein
MAASTAFLGNFPVRPQRGVVRKIIHLLIRSGANIDRLTSFVVQHLGDARNLFLRVEQKSDHGGSVSIESILKLNSSTQLKAFRVSPMDDIETLQQSFHLPDFYFAILIGCEHLFRVFRGLFLGCIETELSSIRFDWE